MKHNDTPRNSRLMPQQNGIFLTLIYTYIPMYMYTDKKGNKWYV